MRRVGRLLAFAGAVLLGGALVLMALLVSMQRRLIFPAPAVRVAPSGQAQRVLLPSGVELLWRPADPAAPVAVFFHGNAQQVGDLGPIAERFAREGVGFLAVEYPGYAGAAGAPSEGSIVQAGREGLAHLVGPLGVARERLVLVGQSIGTGPAVALAAEGWGVRLALLSPYTSLPDIAAGLFPFLPVRLLVRDQFDSAARAPSLRLPVLVVHGTADEVVPFALGQRLAGRFPHATLVAVPHGTHNGLWADEEVVARLVAFVRGG